MNLQGWIYAKMLRLDKARQALEEAIAAEPHNADHYLDLSTMLNSEGDSDTAVRILSEGLQRDVDQARLQVQIGLLHQKGRNYQEAEKWFEQAANPTNRSAYLGLANLMLETDRRNEALNLLAKAVQLLPEDALLHHMYGGLLVESAREADPKQLEKATSVLNKALRLNPFYANTHYLLGRLQLKNGDYDAAKSLFEKASGLDPNHAGAYYQLSLIARRQGKIAMAQELARTVQKLNERSRKNDQENFSRLVRESLSTPSVGIPRAGD